MNALYSLLFVFLLVLIPLFGVDAAHLRTFFGVCIPSTAFIIFVIGFITKVINWGRSPVPFRIPTTGGQFKSFDTTMFKQNKFDCPQTGAQTFVRMVLEVFAFRSLFRNTQVSLHDTKSGPVVAYKSSKWLWLFAIVFHYSFFIVALRHLRLFLEPVPFFVNGLEFVDGILQIGAPAMYLADCGLVIGVILLLGRRLIDAKINYLSYVSDFFPLFLILAVALSGIYMRYYAKVDVIAIKELTMGLVTFHFVVPETIGVSFFVHVFLVSVLMAYFPFSKLMHFPGVFMSPTRNLPNDTRAKHHVNPWNDPNIKPHTYADYEKEFGVPMAEAGLPLDNPENGVAPEEKA
ncbi:sulfate reduction electron transfer complex DsrMKJOP subunit DsrM [Pseudodesulfovibrio piezophilus]|uniref:Inner membrane protein, binds b-type hemes n=1 Tax=Pseudodesulfovibrio piezophilus (strain DSM 21447 / JCM 15486 / C1TLV30) TaxID=1322246 RepID=M1WXH5_PSEP2|nr:sulfate reduction electron transfer complex DsrMKJOP subunit DsrM [Pseudodesulfovibrio piezophilus]CCH49738.1 Inner membrane protein, binds b-type hemes [Pseudodesulfovibrio piezophilus C1TLV30]